MTQERVLFLVDENPKRREQLLTILQFIDRKYQEVTIPPSERLVNGLALFVGYEEKWRYFENIYQSFYQLPVVLIDFPKKEIPHWPEVFIKSLNFPFTYAECMEVLYQCQMFHDNKLEKDHLTADSELLKDLVGHSKAINRVRKLIQKVAKTSATVLILGESGTGKEVTARHIHRLSERADKPFVPINCGAIPAELLESELFGHEKGAFTGAITARQGRFELAEGGTLFLDEIGDMPLPMQVKLLRVLQERSFERVGSNRTLQADVRVVAATHRNLENAIKQGNFREDLYYRLNTFPIEIPALRERLDDLPLLCDELIARYKMQNHTHIQLLPCALTALRDYHWPGNIRELVNLIERLAILHPDGLVKRENLPARIKFKKFHNQLGIIDSERETLFDLIVNDHVTVGDKIDLKKHLAKTEIALISQALEDNDWIVAHAASQLNMRRTTLVEKMRKYGIIKSGKSNFRQ